MTLANAAPARVRLIVWRKRVNTRSGPIPGRACAAIWHRDGCASPVGRL